MGAFTVDIWLRATPRLSLENGKGSAAVFDNTLSSRGSTRYETIGYSGENEESAVVVSILRIL
jgi:hypothetical protein